LNEKDEEKYSGIRSDFSITDIVKLTFVRQRDMTFEFEGNRLLWCLESREFFFNFEKILKEGETRETVEDKEVVITKNFLKKSHWKTRQPG
jgi:hypothetical protein